MRSKVAQPIVRFIGPDLPQKPPDLTFPPKPVTWCVPLQTFLCGLNGNYSTTKTTWNYNDSILLCIVETQVPIIANVLFSTECHVDTKGTKLKVDITASNYTVMASPNPVLTTLTEPEARSFTNFIVLKPGVCDIGFIMLVNQGTGYINDPHLLVMLTSAS